MSTLDRIAGALDTFNEKVDDWICGAAAIVCLGAMAWFAFGPL